MAMVKPFSRPVRPPSWQGGFYWGTSLTADYIIHILVYLLHPLKNAERSSKARFSSSHVSSTRKYSSSITADLPTMCFLLFPFVKTSPRKQTDLASSVIPPPPPLLPVIECLCKEDAPLLTLSDIFNGHLTLAGVWEAVRSFTVTFPV